MGLRRKTRVSGAGFIKTSEIRTSAGISALATWLERGSDACGVGFQLRGIGGTAGSRKWRGRIMVWIFRANQACPPPRSGRLEVDRATGWIVASRPAQAIPVGLRGANRRLLGTNPQSRICQTMGFTSADSAARISAPHPCPHRHRKLRDPRRAPFQGRPNHPFRCYSIGITPRSTRGWCARRGTSDGTSMTTVAGGITGGFCRRIGCRME